MKFRSLILATTLLTAATGFAFAQSAPSPTNSSGPAVHANTPAPTDMSSKGDNIKGIPSRGTAAQRRATTGAGMTEPGTKPSARKTIEEDAQKNASPASPAEGVEKEK
jgi:hypothetical protein